MRRLGPALGERDFRLLWLVLLGMGVSMQMLEVAIGWEVYTNQRNALDLGLIGLAEFIPMFALALPAGAGGGDGLSSAPPTSWARSSQGSRRSSWVPFPRWSQTVRRRS